MPSKAANAVDIFVGARLRTRRREMSMTQEQLGMASDITFQQVQKYEKGANRMGSSRLCKLAEVLNVTAPYFFEGLPTSSSEDSPTISGDLSHLVEFLATLEGQALMRVFTRITDQRVRRSLATVVQQIADQLDLVK